MGYQRIRRRSTPVSLHPPSFAAPGVDTRPEWTKGPVEGRVPSVLSWVRVVLRVSVLLTPKVPGCRGSTCWMTFKEVQRLESKVWDYYPHCSPGSSVSSILIYSITSQITNRVPFRRLQLTKIMRILMKIPETPGAKVDGGTFSRDSHPLSRTSNKWRTHGPRHTSSKYVH